MRLTPRQIETLAELRRRNAQSRETSTPASTRTSRVTLNVMVLGKLRDLGLVESRAVVKSKRRWTEYWISGSAGEGEI